MGKLLPIEETRKLLVIMPNWVGDAVMATPLLRLLRERFAGAQIAALVRHYARPIVEGNPHLDDVIEYRKGFTKATGRTRGMPLTVKRLRRERFDLAIILPNSLRSALLAFLAGVPRRVGYDREGRGIVLTDRLLPARHNGRFVPVPLIRYYAAIAQYLGSPRPERLRMELYVSDEERRVAEELLGEEARPDAPLVLVNPGAAFGPAKCWPADRFAAVADALVQRFGARIVLTGSPSDRTACRETAEAMRQPALSLPEHHPTLGLAKGLVERAALLVTNDTGIRHFAAALGVPVVTIFGATDPEWTQTFFERERIVRVPVDCGPCQRPRCPLTHECMRRITPHMVVGPACELLAERVRQGR